MTMIARILGVALLASAMVAGLGLAWFRPDRHSMDLVILLLLACVGGVIGAVAGAAREIVSAQRRDASPWADTK